MIATLVALAYAALVLGTIAGATFATFLAWRVYCMWRDRQRAIGYRYGSEDGRRTGYAAGALDTVLLAETLEAVPAEHLGQITGSAAFGEALLRGELRKSEVTS